MSALRLYAYVGSPEILTMLPQQSQRLQVSSAKVALQWFTDTHQERQPDGTITVTFIVDAQGHLWMNDRRSEHVLCAAGQPVLSAGEMTFSSHPPLEVVAVTNQSTGYCPEPESWPAIAQCLDRLNIPYPGAFTTDYHFRRCTNCGTRNLIKDDWYVCAACDAPLSAHWNFAK